MLHLNCVLTFLGYQDIFECLFFVLAIYKFLKGIICLCLSHKKKQKLNIIGQKEEPCHMQLKTIPQVTEHRATHFSSIYSDLPPPIHISSSAREIVYNVVEYIMEMKGHHDHGLPLYPQSS